MLLVGHIYEKIYTFFFGLFTSNNARSRNMRPLSIREPTPRPGGTGVLPPALRVGAQYEGSVLYADDIALIAGSCYGLQKMLDICNEYGHTWDITFNPTKSQLLTMGGKNPPVNPTLAHKPLAWYNSVKYLGVHQTWVNYIYVNYN